MSDVETRPNVEWRRRKAVEQRGEQAIDLLLVLIADDPMWVGDDGEPLDYSPEREARISDFCARFAAEVRALSAHLAAPGPAGDPSGEEVVAEHTCCACYTHNGLPCCNAGHPPEQPDRIGARTVQRAWDRSPLLRSVKALRTACTSDSASPPPLRLGWLSPHPRPSRPGMPGTRRGRRARAKDAGDE